MSVRTGQRTQGDLTVIIKAKEVAVYTLQITNNEKNFPKRYRLSVVNKIQDKSFEILTNLIEANEIYPRNLQELEHRQFLQRKAMASCCSLMAMVDVCKELFGLSSEKVAFWAKSVFEVRTMTAAWFRKDEERFKNKF